MTIIDYCVIIVLALWPLSVWLKLRKDLKDVKRRIKELEDKQRESHEPGFWASGDSVSDGVNLAGDFTIEGDFKIEQ